FKEVRFVRNTIRPASVGAFLQGAAILFNPERAKGLRLTLHFEFTGKEQKTATISISEEKIHVHEGYHGGSDLYIKAVGLVIDEDLGDNIKITAIATGFGDRFDLEKGRHELKTVTPQAVKGNEINREIPTFIRDKHNRDSYRQRNIFMDEEEQYDIPTFLRKSVD
ncbi:MAG: hypothetical protein ABSG48_06975, partial [Geobacteraceae bacterium]